MAQCKMCGRKGFFLSVSEDGLCKSCESIVVMDIQQRGRIINDCIKLVNESKNMSTQLSRYDLLREHAQALLEYEHKGIPTISPSPSQFLSEYTTNRDQIVLEGITAEVEKALARAEIATTPRTSINEANKALLKIREGKKELNDKAKLDQLEDRIRHFSHEKQLNEYLEAARKAEFKGKKKKAIDQYQEALYFLRNDDIEDSLQGEKISKIEAKISELSD
ncbi:hypothetical protein KJ830_03460 [bacterium]|nr:hypothetical protein [bacterium]MBU4510088.1 hypothetical protein [bacterium]